ncbi:DEAD/DEAH box helicase [Chitinophaga sp.]|uniref:DEAD/DEAH box helicase n=1 Tax=Chitinophaga sp. TaxID=1869181 RepID=UPI002F94FE3E
MRKYTANYAYTNPNFVIQNLVSNPVEKEWIQVLNVIKNILQRGFPTMMSKFLQEKLGAIHQSAAFNERFLFSTPQAGAWKNTIKGDDNRQYYPAREFYEKILPSALDKYAFVQSLLVPEIGINVITDEFNEHFINQCVDFYLPQAKLVIEIDGQQHKSIDRNRVKDAERDEYLLRKGIATVRITTNDLRTGNYMPGIERILARLTESEKLLSLYRTAGEKISRQNISPVEQQEKLIPTAVMRYQILLLELMANKYLHISEPWRFNVLCQESLPEALELAIQDLQIWISKLWELKNKEVLQFPEYSVNTITVTKDFKVLTDAINIDFSLFQRYTDSHEQHPDVIFVRTDYFDNAKEKNYFRVSATEPINYSITDQDRHLLGFFLDNIFDKPTFRDGQFPIIANILNRKDTIGLLPTGGGKSLCYQLPCLLQPCISFVVSPIKSLMYDQYENLVRVLTSNVNFITGDLEAKDRQRVEREFGEGRYLFVWISPERFQVQSFRDNVAAIVASSSIAHAVIDEVHCLSEWGHDFRTSYLNLAKTIDKLGSKDQYGEGSIKFVGLTATASVRVLKDIKVEFSRQKYQLEDENIKTMLDYSRKELVFDIQTSNEPKIKRLERLLQDLKDTDGFMESAGRTALVFTPHVNGDSGCYEVSNNISSLIGRKVGWFSGDIPKRNVFDTNTGQWLGKEPVMTEEQFKIYKLQIQKDFKNDVYPLMVATKAFGMGIDKDNIHYTIHYGLPGSVEALYQEAGRAGRWDKGKTENKNKVAKCFVLHSPETYDSESVQRMFHKDTSFAEIKQISAEAKREGRDVFNQIYLFIQGNNDIAEDFSIILHLIEQYFRETSKVTIYWKTVYRVLQIDKDILQKAIYRMSLLGIVSDWTTDFQTHYQVSFDRKDDAHILKNLSAYLNKYTPGINLDKELELIKRNNILEKALWYLLNWIFENIAYSRKQSLKTLSDWCSNFEGSDLFKQRIDSYFIFTETTYVLQHIAENERDYEKWFDILMPKQKGLSAQEMQQLRDNISRFLEGYRNSLGLNFISGFVFLSLNNYEDSDGRTRFESAMARIREIFTPTEQADILERLKYLGETLAEPNREALCMSLQRYYPELLESWADHYGLPYLLHDQYAERLSAFKKLNIKLYEYLTEI